MSKKKIYNKLVIKSWLEYKVKAATKSLEIGTVDTW